MSRHLFTSDLHLGHERVAGFRGFASHHEHDEHVWRTLRQHVGPEDVLWVLGDVVGKGSAWGYALDLLDSVPGRKRLVYGNHDPGHPMNRRRSPDTAWRTAQTFESDDMAASAKVCGIDVVLSHFPYTRDRGEPRFLQWRLRNLGAWLLHGHTHGEERLTYEPEHYGDRLYYQASREVHVGWDAWGRPVADYEVADLIRSA